MKLHSPETEKEIIRIASGVTGPGGFQKNGYAWLVNLLRRGVTSLPIIWLAGITLGPVFSDRTTSMPQQVICACLLMALVRLGLSQVAMSFKVSCFFGTLANLPITGWTALTHVRGTILRRFWVPALLGSFIIAISLHRPVDPDKVPDILLTCGLLAAIVWSTLGITQVSWVRRLRIAKIWLGIAICLIAHFVILQLIRGTMFSGPPGQAMYVHFERIMWVFPPAWVFPEKLASGGFIPASLWIAWGLWSWFRWPHTAFPAYDRPLDFVGAFGNVGTSVQSTATESGTPPPETEVILPDPPGPPSNGWVERLISANIPAVEAVVAGALMPPTNHTRTVNLSMIFAIVWLLVLGFGKDKMPYGEYRDIIFLISFAVPFLVFVVGLMPFINPLKNAIQTCQVGNTPVPFFTTLPVSLRSLLRLTFRITIVRTIIAVAIATPFFWTIARIHQLPEIGSGILAMIPAVGAAWILAVPAALSNRLDLHLRRKRGIFPLILATSLAQVPIGFLCIITSIAGIGLSFTWGMGSVEGKYAVFLLPAALICLAFGGAMSRLLFEILHLSIRQRRYDWKSKAK